CRSRSCCSCSSTAGRCSSARWPRASSPSGWRYCRDTRIRRQHRPAGPRHHGAARGADALVRARRRPRHRHGAGRDTDQRDDAVLYPEAARARRGALSRRRLDAQDHRRLLGVADQKHSAIDRMTGMLPLELLETVLQRELGIHMLPFFRIAGVLMVAPVVGARLVPVRVRIALAVAATVVLSPLVPMQAALDLSVATAFVVAQEVLVGIAMGFLLQMIFDALIVA